MGRATRARLLPGFATVWPDAEASRVQPSESEEEPSFGMGRAPRIHSGRLRAALLELA